MLPDMSVGAHLINLYWKINSGRGWHLCSLRYVWGKVSNKVTCSNANCKVSDNHDPTSHIWYSSVFQANCHECRRGFICRSTRYWILVNQFMGPTVCLSQPVAWPESRRKWTTRLYHTQVKYSVLKWNRHQYHDTLILYQFWPRV